MRASSSLVSFGVLVLIGCDGSFYAPGGHPVPPDTRNSPADGAADSGPSGDTGITPRPPADGADTRQPHEGEPSGPGPERCDPGYYACTFDDDLEYCDVDGLQIADCTTVCNDAGFDYATGCGYDESYDGDVCWCDDDRSPDPGPPPPPPPPDPSCSPGWSCQGDSLAYCDGVATERWSCDAFCQDEGYAYASACAWDPSLGDEACFCEDDACSGGADVCLGSDYLETCDGYGAVTVDCWDVCQDAGYDSVAGCGYDSYSGGDACFCQNEVCAGGDLVCADGSCLDPAYVCDGVSDCSTGDDEWGCPATCVEGDSWCVSGYELEVCDGGEPWVYDCDDFCRDEGFDYAEGCGYDGYSGYDACYCAFEACASWEFQCDDGLCLDTQYTCDGYADCYQGEDELGCY